MELRRIALPTLIILSAAIFAGCAPTSDGGSTAGSGDSASGSSADGTADCSVYADQTDAALKLFTTDAIASGPAEGQVYGDGTELSITLSQAAIDAGYLPQFELNNLSENGGPVGISSEIFDPTSGSDGTYSTTSSLFGQDELVGTAMVLQLFAISDAPIATTEQYGDKVLLGNYCMTYANDGS